jgi:transcriptional regulator of acetoin/glycerol metabolism
MLNEIGFMTDILNKRGLQEGDCITFKPFGKRTRRMKLSFTKYLLTTDSTKKAAWVKTFESIQGETFNFELLKKEVPSLNQQKNLRYILLSKSGTPFRLNGSFVTEGILEIGDVCEFGYHKMVFSRDVESKDKTSLFSGFFGKNEKLISSDLPILIEGETGVGKTTLALEIHNRSMKGGKFVHINVSAYSRSLIESELFGHIRGAFTGAVSDKKGALRQSNGGTLFIDEIDSLPWDLQTKLLLFFDSKRVTPVGSEVSYEVESRVICASGGNLKTLVEKRLMRKDFYFRVASGAIVNIPSLRDKLELINDFCKLYSMEKNVLIPDKLISFYQTLPWPGNYRQFRGHLDKKFVLMNGRKMSFDSIDNEMVAFSSELFDIEKQDSLTFKELKTNYAKKIYFECDQNLTRSAKLLGVSSRTLRSVLSSQ